MTQLSPHLHTAAYLAIEDRIDVIGQKYRVQQLLRGAMLWIAFTIIAIVATAFAAHFLGTGFWTRLLGIALLGWLIASALLWIVRPLLIRPDAVKVARLIESKVGGLHNGLTNALLLARRQDLSASPWMPQIMDEIALSVEARPIGQAVRIADLRPVAVRLAILLAPVLVVTIVFFPKLSHGWQQLLQPTAFVPQTGSIRILKVQPGDTQVVVGSALDIAVTAEMPTSLTTPAARIVFEEPEGVRPASNAAARPKDAEVLPTASADPNAQTSPGYSPLRYTYHLDHLDRSVRYRVEVGSSQSNWYEATVIREVKLDSLGLRISPPSYTGQESRPLWIKSADLGKTPVGAPQGSRIELEAATDIPVGGALLQVSETGTPVPMTRTSDGLRFTAAFTIVDDTPISVLLTDNAGKVMFRVPEERFTIGCVKDAAPVIEMRTPRQDLVVSLDAEVRVVAGVHDDYGLTSARVLMGVDVPAPTTKPAQLAPAGAGTSAPVPDRAGGISVVHVAQLPHSTKRTDLSHVLKIDPALRKHGNVVRIRVEATDGRDLGPDAAAALAGDRKGSDVAALVGPQTSSSSTYQIRFQDPAQITKDEKEKSEELRQRLRQMLEQQKQLLAQTITAWGQSKALPAYKPRIAQVNVGQTGLRAAMKTTAETFRFDPDDKIIQKALLMLVVEPAKEAVDLSALLGNEPSEPARAKLNDDLQSRQRRIIATLESLLTVTHKSPELVKQPTTRPGGDLADRADALKKLDEDLKQFIKEQQKILDQTANLAKKPVDNFSDADKKLLEDLKIAQEKLDAFMQEKVHDFSKLAEQDMANASLLKELMEVYSEVTMAKDALKQKAAEIAVAAEENGIDLAKEINSNIEKWLANAPDRTKWTQEDPLGKADVPLAELPKELEDLIGKLLEQEEDLFEEVEDQNANFHGSADKGIGWDAADGPISNMTAKGVTGNQLPNNNEMGGRSGEGRSGKSQGEMVEETASGKGGRRTPTRLDPTPFQQGQVKDTGKDPTGGATGGGKLSGQGGQGLEGPTPPALKQQMERLAQKQAQLRNQAERLNLQYGLGRYDNFKLTEGIALMRRVESDLRANRYQNALRRKDATLDSLDTSRLLLGGQVHVKQDTTPTTSARDRQDAADAAKGELPPAWKDALKQYYQKLGQE